METGGQLSPHEQTQKTLYAFLSVSVHVQQETKRTVMPYICLSVSYRLLFVITSGYNTVCAKHKFWSDRETIFLVQLILFYRASDDTTSPALPCLQHFHSVHVILLSQRQHYTELTYIYPKPLILSPKSIRYRLFHCKSI